MTAPQPAPAQARAVEGIVRAGGTGLISAATGCGKTLMALWVIDQCRECEPEELSVLVVAPLRTVDGWTRAVSQVWGGRVPVRALEKRTQAGREALKRVLAGERPAGVSIIGWELLGSVSKSRGYDARAGRVRSRVRGDVLGGVVWDWVIGDEIHRAANFRTITSQALCRVRAARRLALSATPAGGQPVNIYGALRFLWPKRYSGFTRFAETHFTSEPIWAASSPYARAWGAEKRPGAVSKQHRERGEWQTMRIEDVAGALPPVDIRRVMVGLTRDQRRQYHILEEDAVLWMDAHPAVVGLPVVRDMRLRQAVLGQMSVRSGLDDGEDEWYFEEDCRSSKISAVLDILTDLPSDERVIVFSPSKKFQVPLVAQLTQAGHSCARVDGDHRDEWQTWRDAPRGVGPQVLCAVIPAVAEGVDGLQRVCRHEIWIGLDPSIVRCIQAQGRLYRTGQTGTVVRWLVQCLNTVDTESVVPRLEQRYADLAASGLI